MRNGACSAGQKWLVNNSGGGQLAFKMCGSVGVLNLLMTGCGVSKERRIYGRTRVIADGEFALTVIVEKFIILCDFNDFFVCPS